MNDAEYKSLVERLEKHYYIVPKRAVQFAAAVLSIAVLVAAGTNLAGVRNLAAREAEEAVKNAIDDPANELQVNALRELIQTATVEIGAKTKRIDEIMAAVDDGPGGTLLRLEQEVAHCLETLDGTLMIRQASDQVVKLRARHTAADRDFSRSDLGFTPDAVIISPQWFGLRTAHSGGKWHLKVNSEISDDTLTMSVDSGHPAKDNSELSVDLNWFALQRFERPPGD